jgi:hypothetical protein
VPLQPRPGFLHLGRDRRLFAELPERETISLYQIGDLAALTAMSRDSGLMHVAGPLSAAKVGRNLLYMPALADIRRRSPFKAFYDQLHCVQPAEGRPHLSL